VDGDHRITDESVEVDRRVGVEELGTRLRHDMLVTPAS